MRLRLSITVVIALLATACSGAPGASTPSQPGTSPAGSAGTSSGGGSVDALYQAAKSEGKFEFWGGEDAGDIQKFLAAFNSKYAGIAGKHVQIAPQDVVQKLVTDPNTTPDIFNSNLDLMDSIIEKGLVDEHPGWESYGVDSKLIDPAGGISTQITAYGLAYNTNLLKPADVPKTWEELVNPAFAGKLSLDSRGNPFNILAVKMGQQQTIDYVKRVIATSKPVFIKGATAGLTSLASGETALRPAFWSDYSAIKAKGAPIGFAWLDVVPIKSTYWYIAKNAKDPNAAKLWGYWFAVDPGANQLQQQLDFRSNSLPSDVPSGAPQVEQRTRDDYTVGANVINAITPLMAGGS